MIDWLLPTSDRVAITQAVVVLVVGIAAILALRRHREARIFAVGVTFLLLAATGLRALH
jgi:uncharacterized membrane protein (UPF0136 family)